MGKRTEPAPNNGISVAPGANAVITLVSRDRIREADVYLKSLVTVIDPSTNANFATMRLRVNQQNFFPFGNLTTQQSAGAIPKTYEPPLFLGTDCEVDVYGEMAAGAVGNTLMVAGFDLLVVPKGESI
jgi:hypothetical protein